MKARELTDIDVERELWRELGLSGLMPWRGPTGALRNQFRIAAGSKMEQLLRARFKGDVAAFTAALRAEREAIESVVSVPQFAARP